MAKLEELQKACQLGQDCRAAALNHLRDYTNPFIGDEADAWLAGYENDLNLWDRVKDRAEQPPVKGGRLRSHDLIIFNEHTSKPDKGWFLRYDQKRPGYCRVYLYRGGHVSVPRESLTLANKKEVAA